MIDSHFDDVSELEKLLDMVELRDSLDFYKRLVFIKQSKYLAPYNAFLVTQQRKISTLVLSEDEWRDKGRYPKNDASPLVILFPFGPVKFVYDIEDTEGEPLDNYHPNMPIPEVMARYFPYEGDFTPLESLYEILSFKSRLQGLILTEKPLEPEIAGKAFAIDSDVKKTKKDLAGFGVELNANHPKEIKLRALVHELAHILCGHLNRSSVSAKYDHSRKEFEAEAVSYLFCYRKGFRPKSEEYLVGHLSRGWKPPLGMFDDILRALRRIDDLASGSHGIDPELCKHLELSIGGYFGPSYSIRSNDCRTVIYEYRLNGESSARSEEITPSTKQWRSFWNVCSDIGIGLWKEQYVNDDIVDGVGWSLAVDCGSFKVRSSGSNDFPGSDLPGGEDNKGQDGYPRPFRRLLLAVRKLIGNRKFN